MRYGYIVKVIRLRIYQLSRGAKLRRIRDDYEEKCMDARPKRKPVDQMTVQELMSELLYGDDAEQFAKEQKHMAKYLGGYAKLYGK